ncbi:MAG: nucleotidyl transferase AbiEii/AbiGii toxin family protein [Cyclobacteriaceae bacterium]
MLTNTQINRAVTKKVALALDSINEQVVYVGGAVVSLYIDDLAAVDVRPTKDLDLTVKIATLGELEELREALNTRGFIQTSKDDVVCRFRYEDVLVDVMATVPIGWAPGNRWFEQGFNMAFIFYLDNLAIRLLPLPYFLAAKFDAFFDRGIKDLWASHDYEDIVYLFNHTSDIAEQVLSSKERVKMYLNECASKILTNNVLKQGIVSNLYFDGQEQRYEMILKKLSNIANGLHHNT